MTHWDWLKLAFGWLGFLAACLFIAALVYVFVMETRGYGE